MENPKRYVIEKTTPQPYLDKGNRAINGYLVEFTIVQYDEVHQVNVPNLDQATVEKAIETVIAQRDNLAQLGA